MEDEHGNNVSPGVKNRVRGNLYSYWLGLFENKEPINWKDLNLEMREAFRNKFEGLYPWLRLCEAHWKVDHLWINYFGTWKNSRFPPVRDPTPTSKKPSVSASSKTEVSNISTGPKRGREEPDVSTEDTSKRHKGGYRAITPTNFHHSCPVARRKTIAKVAKVRQSWLLFTLWPTEIVAGSIVFIPLLYPT